LYPIGIYPRSDPLPEGQDLVDWQAGIEGLPRGGEQVVAVFSPEELAIAHPQGSLIIRHKVQILLTNHQIGLVPYLWGEAIWQGKLPHLGVPAPRPGPGRQEVSLTNKFRHKAVSRSAVDLFRAIALL
jgi:hypothetical protein